MKSNIECNVSGDGALHPVYKDGRKMTFEVAKRYLAQSDLMTRYRFEKWRVVLIDNKPVIVANISRTGEKTLSVNGQKFSYKIEENLKLGEHCPSHALSIWVMIDGELKLVINYSLRSQIRHFINNESDLTPACPV